MGRRWARLRHLSATVDTEIRNFIIAEVGLTEDLRERV